MALYGVAITKSTLWHGKQEEFANAYFYDGPVFQIGDENFRRLIDALVAAESPIHGRNVSFKQARVWSAGGTKEENETVALEDLGGTGTIDNAPFFKEAAILVDWVCARPNRLGRKVYLRKYIRPCVQLPGAGINVMSGEEQLHANQKAPFKTYADRVQNPAVFSGGPTWSLVSPTLRRPKEQGNGHVNEYLISREFRRN